MKTKIQIEIDQWRSLALSSVNKPKKKSMRVMCIKKGNWTNSTAPGDDPEFGDICTVVRQFESWGHDVYELKEFPHPGGYSVKGFSPLSDIDETEIAQEREAAILDREFARIVHEFENA